MLSIHPNACLWLPVVYQALGHVGDNHGKNDKDAGPPDLSTFFFFSFLGLDLWHMEVPRLGVESELQLPIPQPQQLRF